MYYILHIHYGLAQISRAFSQGAMLPTLRDRCDPRACKNLLQHSLLWLGFIVLGIHCGLDQLWLGSIVVWMVVKLTIW